MRVSLTKCECSSPPCKCKPFQRGTKCEHRIRGEYVEEQREHGMFKGYKMYECGMEGKLYDDCNWFFESKKVLCDKHVEEHRASAQRLCRICQTPKAECCC